MWFLGIHKEISLEEAAQGEPGEDLRAARAGEGTCTQRPVQNKENEMTEPGTSVVINDTDPWPRKGWEQQKIGMCELQPSATPLAEGRLTVACVPIFFHDEPEILSYKMFKKFKSPD